jgi:hypothetical protein
MLVPAWIVLTFRLSGIASIPMPEGQGWTSAQRRVLAVFGLTSLAWITRDVPFGGWSAWLGIDSAGDSTVALLAALSMFLIPSGGDSEERLLDWQTAARIPWGILILFGGGIAIAAACESSGLSVELGRRLAGMRDWPLVGLIGTVCLSVTFFGEVASNTAAASVLLPVLGAAAVAADLDPAMLLIPAGLATSCGFMLPVATPPNAIVFGSGRVRMAEMARVGLVLNFVGSLVITLVCWKLVPLVFGHGPVGSVISSQIITDYQGHVSSPLKKCFVSEPVEIRSSARSGGKTTSPHSPSPAGRGQGEGTSKSRSFFSREPVNPRSEIAGISTRYAENFATPQSDESQRAQPI